VGTMMDKNSELCRLGLLKNGGLVNLQGLFREGQGSEGILQGEAKFLVMFSR